MFIRERAGIEAFGKLVEQGLKSDVLTRVGQLEQRYKAEVSCLHKVLLDESRIGGNELVQRESNGLSLPGEELPRCRSNGRAVMSSPGEYVCRNQPEPFPGCQK